MKGIMPLPPLIYKTLKMAGMGKKNHQYAIVSSGETPSKKTYIITRWNFLDEVVSNYG